MDSNVCVSCSKRYESFGGLSGDMVTYIKCYTLMRMWRWDARRPEPAGFVVH